MKPRPLSQLNGVNKRTYCQDVFGITDAPPVMEDVSYVPRKWLDVPYFPGSDKGLLDIYLPDEGEGPFPVILYIHGGAWIGGHRRPDLIHGWLTARAHGYAVAAASYTLAQDGDFPVQTYDAKAAIRFLKAHADQYRLDPRRIGLIGDSAGGHLVALLGVSAGRDELEDLSMGNEAYDSSVQAVVDWYGPVDFLHYTQDFAEEGVTCEMPLEQEDASPLSLLLGCRPTDCPDRARLANPLTYITPSCPPFLIQQGTKDQLVPYPQSVRLAKALQAAGVPVELDLFEGAIHGGEPFISQANLERVWSFFDRYLK